MTKDFGATVIDGGVAFQVWAPAAARVDVVIYDQGARAIEMDRTRDGVYAAVADVGVGARYKYRIGGKDYADPYSRCQPEGPEGPSVVVDRSAFKWRDSEWRGAKIEGQVIYEIHIGAFTPEGTFDAAIEKLAWLKSIGITLIEIMPIAEFPGRFNWGYDAVNLFAPFHGYGDYEALKRFVDAAHQHQIAVILDVVYNHVGPSGNYLSVFAPGYFSPIHRNDWGVPFNVDGPDCAFIRRFLVDNACYWIEEFHLDGLRLDATTNIPDCGPRHILAELVEKARAVARPKEIVIIAEDEQQQASRLLPQSQGGFDFDALWNDDFHHSAHVALTGRRGAYYLDYVGRPQEFISSLKYGFLFQGQWYHWQKQPRGERASVSGASHIVFIDNHDQVANSAKGQRTHHLTSPAKYRALTTLLMLVPQTPMLFMGQEFEASTPFLFFADHAGELLDAIAQGRRDFLTQFPSLAAASVAHRLAGPADTATFRRSKLNWDESVSNTAAVQLHRDLISLRAKDPVIHSQNCQSIDGAVLSETAFAIRWFGRDSDRLLLVNLGADVRLQPGPEPLLAPSSRACWSLMFSSERFDYGGNGVEFPETDSGWMIPAESAVLLGEQSIMAALVEGVV
jgi:maltooligosyltrehalose trehalohydrolase